jgi:D-3-phosphoglycerate dehydrogenase / 2-oxoglutarate reductase
LGTGKFEVIVYNTEPLNYSMVAVKKWESNGYKYRAGSWEEVNEISVFPNVDALIVRIKHKVTDTVLGKFLNLKKVVSATTGHDHLDLNALKRRGVELISLRGHQKFLNTIPSTAEFTWGLIMALARNIPAANEHVKSGNWDRDIFKGYQLSGKNLGIIGYGRIGKKVADYARAFNSNVFFYDPLILKGNYNDKKIETIENLIELSDILTLHVHLNAKTACLLNKTNLRLIKRGLLIVNTSRGKVWDEVAIAKCLKNKIVAGVATDVLSTELEDIRRSPLWLAQKKGLNVIITPHIGGATYDAMQQSEEYLANIINS